MSDTLYTVGKVEFRPAWSDGLHEEMDDAGICTCCGFKMTPVRPGKAQCDYCELGEAYDKAQAEIRQLTAERDEAREAFAVATDQLVQAQSALREVRADADEWQNKHAAVFAELEAVK